jgi:hypothetical protein
MPRAGLQERELPTPDPARPISPLVHPSPRPLAEQAEKSSSFLLIIRSAMRRALLELIESLLQLLVIVFAVITFVQLLASKIDPVQEIAAPSQQFDSCVNGVGATLEQASGNLLLDELLVFWGDIA